MTESIKEIATIVKKEEIYIYLESLRDIGVNAYVSQWANNTGDDFILLAKPLRKSNQNFDIQIESLDLYSEKLLSALKIVSNLEFKNINSDSLKSNLNIKEIKDKLKESDFILKVNNNNYTLIQKKSNGVVLEGSFDVGETVLDALLKDLEFHLRAIDSNDKDYYKDCDKKYLKGEWRDMLIDVKNIVQVYCRSKRIQEI